MLVIVRLDSEGRGEGRGGRTVEQVVVEILVVGHGEAAAMLQL
jgi:hypothetical protein